MEQLRKYLLEEKQKLKEELKRIDAKETTAETREQYHYVLGRASAIIDTLNFIDIMNIKVGK